MQNIDLGEALEYTRTQRVSRFDLMELLGAIGIILFLSVLSYLAFRDNTESTNSASYILLGGEIGLGIAGTVYYVRRMVRKLFFAEYLIFHENGFRFAKRNFERIWLWNDFIGLRYHSSNIYLSSVSRCAYHVEIETRDKFIITLDGRFGDNFALVDYLEEVLVKLKYPQAIEHFEAGEHLSFGAVVASQDSLMLQGQKVSWSDLKSWEVDRYELKFYLPESVISVPLQEIENFAILSELLADHKQIAQHNHGELGTLTNTHRVNKLIVVISASVALIVIGLWVIVLIQTGDPLKAVREDPIDFAIILGMLFIGFWGSIFGLWWRMRDEIKVYSNGVQLWRRGRLRRQFLWTDFDTLTINSSSPATVIKLQGNKRKFTISYFFEETWGIAHYLARKFDRPDYVDQLQKVRRKYYLT